MNKDNVIALPTRAETAAVDPLSEVLKRGAQRLLAEAVEAEVKQFLTLHQGLRDEAGASTGSGQRLPAAARDSDRHR